MPYIKKEDRDLFNPYLNASLVAISNESCDLVRAESIGWWLDYVVSSMLNRKDGSKNCSVLGLKDHADVILINLRSNDLFPLAGNLNYCLSYLAWGVLGGFSGFKKASYGMRCYLAQQIRQVSDRIKPDSRSSSIIKGAISDMLDELYRRKTAEYEDAKAIENGDLDFSS